MNKYHVTLLAFALSLAFEASAQQGMKLKDIPKVGPCP